MDDMIEIIINDFAEKVPKDATISDLIRRFKEEDIDLIVEHNGRFIYSRQYGEIRVVPGDRIEFINPHFGG